MHRDTRKAVMGALASVGVPVLPYPPKNMPPAFLVVTRSGGRWLNGLQDRAGIGIECWGDCEDGAAELARTVAGTMAGLRFADGFERVSMESMRSDPDPDTGRRRWYLSYTVTTH